MNDEEKALRESSYSNRSSLDLVALEINFWKAEREAMWDYVMGRTPLPLTPRRVEFTAVAYVWVEPHDEEKK